MFAALIWFHILYPGELLVGRSAYGPGDPAPSNAIARDIVSGYPNALKPLLRTAYVAWVGWETNLTRTLAFL
jgi:hypothetical protein